MLPLIGVKNLLLTPIEKRDLLLFDRLVVVGHTQRIADQLPARLRAELDWLQERGCIEHANTAEALPFLLADGVLSAHLAGLSASLTVIAHEFDKYPEHYTLSQNDTSLIGRIGSSNFALHQIRTIALHIEKMRDARCTPIVNAIPDHTVNELYRHSRQLREIVERNLESIQHQLRASSGYEEFVATEVPIRVIKSLEQLDSTEIPGTELSPATEPVVQIALRAFPTPHESVAWEQIMDFRNDPASRTSIVTFRRWIRDIAASNLPSVEIAEELEYLVASYDEHMRLHRLKSRPGLVELLVTVPASIAEHLAKLKWGEAAKALFTFRSRQVELLEAERGAPGRELAYLSNARERFSS